MAEAEERADGLGGRLLGGLALVAATVLWAAAVWLGFYRPEVIEPYGREARFAVLTLAWAIPFLLMLAAWLALRRARRALAAARALHAETDVLARQLWAARSAAVPAGEPGAQGKIQGDIEPEAAPPASAAATTEPAEDPHEPGSTILRSPRATETAPPPAGASPQDTLWAALDFPRSEADIAGFEALRRAMADDPALAGVIRTAQHVLSLLAQEGVHLDAGSAPPPGPEVWRLYLKGTRGPAIASLGEVDDRESLALTVGRLRRDPAFRSAAQRFVAAFDAWLAGFAPGAEDAALARVAASRSARAFRLLGRATGSFG